MGNQTNTGPSLLAAEVSRNTETDPDLNVTDFNVTDFLRRRKSIILVLAVVGSGLGYLLYQQKSPIYRSTARLEVIHSASQQIFKELMGDGMLENARFIIPSPDVLRPAYRKNSFAKIDTFRGMDEDAAIRLISSSLSIAQLSPGVIDVRFDGGDPRDTRRITNAIASEYIDRQTTSFESESAKLKRLLETDRINIETQLTRAEEAYDLFMRNAKLLPDGSDSTTTRASLLNQKLAVLDIQEAEVLAKLNLMNQKLEQGGQRDALMILVGKEEGTASTTKGMEEQYINERRMSEALLPWVVEATTLKQKVGASHPRLLELENRIELIRDEFTRIAGMISDSAPEQKTDYLDAYRHSLSHELEQIRAQRIDLREMATVAEEGAQLVRNDEQTKLRLSRTVDRLQTLHQGIARQIEQTEVNAGMSGVRANLIAPAVYGRFVYPLLHNFLGMGACIGAIAGLGLAYLIELADPRFRTPDELVRALRLPILAHIPHMPKKQLKNIPDANLDGMHPTLVSAHLPRSRMAEAYRAVRTGICFNAWAESHRLIQITSPASGDGKSTLAANLAVSLAQSGQKTILVESDFRRPTVHKITGVSNDVGVVDILRGKAQLNDVIQTVSVEDFSVLPCGKKPDNPAELLTRPEYESLLEALREKFDYVIVDSPPLLVVTDPSSIAARTDMVIFCTRLDRRTREFSRRSLQQLHEVGANVGGLVINQVAKSDTYGYDKYSYYYGNGYGYGYSDRQNAKTNAYFQDEGNRSPVA